MKTYLVTPRYVLGSDSFEISAPNRADAKHIALNKIIEEDWHSPHGWLIYELVTEFEDGNP